MVREIITLNIGQCGIQMGHTVWRQYCKEHNIDKNGKMTTENDDESFLVFFEENKSEQYPARNISIDLEPDTIDNVKTSDHSKLFHPEFLVPGRYDEDASNLFARGYYMFGKHIINEKI
eukprot:265768_1